MNVLDFYTNSRINGNIGQKLSFDFKLNDFYCSHEGSLLFHTEDGLTISPILASTYDGLNNIAIANEYGIVNISDINDLVCKKEWELHQNAIFDIKWRPGTRGQLLSASGDLSICLVDIEDDKKLTLIENSHICSVRSMDFKDNNVFASGARDGHIKIWDLRCPNEPVYDIPSAHVVNFKPRRNVRRFRSDPTNVVTAVLFDRNYLFSGGSSDGLIKMWDFRKKSSTKVEPLKVVPYYGKNSFSNQHGYTCFSMSRGCLFASCSDRMVYCWSPQQDKIVGVYAGARFNNFSKISILRDEYLISGSMDNQACIWKINTHNNDDQPILPTYVLPETSEVSSVEVVNSRGLIFTATDAGRFRRWTFEYCDAERKNKYDLIELYKEPVLPEIDSENIPINRGNNQVHENFTPLRPTTPRTRRRKRNSPRSQTPRCKKSRTKEPAEPFTPITNYYQKLPKIHNLDEES